MADDTRDVLESESKTLTSFYDKLLGETKTFKLQLETLEKDSLKKLAEPDEAYSNLLMFIAAKKHLFRIDPLAKELAKAKTEKDFNKKKAEFQKDLDQAEWELSNRPRLLDDFERQFKVCTTAATSLQDKVNELLPLFRQVSGEAAKLNARITTFNDSITTLKKIPTVAILSQDLEDYPPRLKEILKKLEAQKSNIDDSTKDLKGSEKDLKVTIAQLAKLKFAAKAVKK